MLFQKWFALNKISAGDFCVACHHADEGGMLGADFALYAQKPGLQTGRYQKHIDAVVPCSELVEKITVPCMSARDEARDSREY